MRAQGSWSVGAVMAGMVILLLSFAATSACQGAARLLARSGAKDRAAGTAAVFVAAYGTFDARHPTGQQQRLATLTSGSLRDALATAPPDPAAMAQQLTSVTRVTDAAVTALAGNAATVRVTADQRRHGVDPLTGLPLVATVWQQVVVRLVREDGEWRVTEMQLFKEEPAAVDAAR
jgi:hypothetical protein